MVNSYTKDKGSVVKVLCYTLVEKASHGGRSRRLSIDLPNHRPSDLDVVMLLALEGSHLLSQTDVVRAV